MLGLFMGISDLSSPKKVTVIRAQGEPPSDISYEALDGNRRATFLTLD
jgi:hypothetical protein